MEEVNPILSLDHLTMKFGGLVAVNDFSIQIRTGELLAIIGPNGAGKTTIFNMITGHYRPTSGRVMFEGQDITGVPPSKIALMGIARTFQNIRLCKTMTALENVLISFHSHIKSSVFGVVLPFLGYSAEEQKMHEEGIKLLEMVGLERWADEKAGSLPYGLQRRLEIARALAIRPKLLLLDEPAAGMNPTEVKDLMSFICQIREEFNLTIVLIEHVMQMVMQICPRICVIDFGIPIAEGTPDDIKCNPKVIEAYLGKGGANA